MPDSNEANALFTSTSLLSLQGSAAASLLVPNVLSSLIGASFTPYAKWVSFTIAVALSYLVAYLASTTDKTKWVLAFFNAFLIFASAVGINEGVAYQRDVRSNAKASVELQNVVEQIQGDKQKQEALKQLLKELQEKEENPKTPFRSWF